MLETRFFTTRDERGREESREERKMSSEGGEREGDRSGGCMEDGGMLRSTRREERTGGGAAEGWAVGCRDWENRRSERWTTAQTGKREVEGRKERRAQGQGVGRRDKPILRAVLAADPENQPRTSSVPHFPIRRTEHNASSSEMIERYSIQKRSTMT